MMPDRATLVDAASKLGWRGDVVGPVTFGGVTFWAVVDMSTAEEVQGRPRLSGCLFGGAGWATSVREASLLAAYAPLAVIVDSSADAVALLVDAAVLDQGVLMARADGLELLSAAGPRVAGGPPTAREPRLLDAVEAAWSADHQLDRV